MLISARLAERFSGELVSLGRHALRGVDTAVELWTLSYCAQVSPYVRQPSDLRAAPMWARLGRNPGSGHGPVGQLGHRYRHRAFRNKRSRQVWYRRSASRFRDWRRSGIWRTSCARSCPAPSILNGADASNCGVRAASEHAPAAAAARPSVLSESPSRPDRQSPANPTPSPGRITPWPSVCAACSPTIGIRRFSTTSGAMPIQSGVTQAPQAARARCPFPG